MSQRATRKCSQCRAEGCNKSKATCPVNVARSGYSRNQLLALALAGPCNLCRREGCNGVNTECPVKMLIDHHTSVANLMLNPITMVGSLYSQIIINPNLYDHIESITLRQQYLTRLQETIRDIYMLPVVNNITRVINTPMVLAHSAIHQKKVVFDVLPGYKMCAEECGICYDKTCNVTFNCAHQSCVDCFKGHVTSIAANNFPILKCPFCRCSIESVQSSDENTRDALVKLN
jgi:hypothetical protein